MDFRFVHANINVTDPERSVRFYEEALGMKVSRVKKADDGSFTLTYLTDSQGVFELELTWLRDKDGPYDLGDNESHLAFGVKDFEGAYAKHKAMDCICFENKAMGIYFISDPDNYWLEIVPLEK